MTQTSSSPAFPFTPVPVRARRDGWTPERQVAFIPALAETRCVLKACRRVGKSAEAAYKLYRRADAASFAAALARGLAAKAATYINFRAAMAAVRIVKVINLHIVNFAARSAAHPIAACLTACLFV